jgi:ribonuclease VapC
VLFADASALIAVITGEPGAETLTDIMDADPNRICSALSLWETVAGLRRRYLYSAVTARSLVGRYVSIGSFRLVNIGEPEYAVATEAYARFGKGHHPAALNMGDCFAYACTKTNQAKLLFKGDDFTKTDIATAT